MTTAMISKVVKTMSLVQIQTIDSNVDHVRYGVLMLMQEDKNTKYFTCQICEND